jgi:hypothetical protein
MRDGRGQVRRKVGLRLWLSAGWLALLLLAALLAPVFTNLNVVTRSKPRLTTGLQLKPIVAASALRCI